MHRMTVNSSEQLCRGLNAKSAPDKWLRVPNGSGLVSPKYAKQSKNTEKLQKVGYWHLEHTHAHQRTNGPVSHGARVRVVFEELGDEEQKELLVDLAQDFTQPLPCQQWREVK